MFKKILIANRGEIACRVAATARRLGVQTVAVYSLADAQAKHVAACDEAVNVSVNASSAPRDSYLRWDAIIEAAKATGAEAIHPGYGFLSENEAFANACLAAGLVFIGPPAAAIQAMGLKAESKRLMAQAGVPLVPGYHGADQDPALLQREANAMGYPVLIKASAGGGGKGMRVVGAADEFAAALASCQREAKNSFGNDAVLIEKYVQRPRHIEIQVFADTQGECVYLWERDCSVQRRHQKVLEEAPAPGLSPELRAQMGAAAVATAKAVNYVGAGTVEFIVEQADYAPQAAKQFFFMEMNTRLQVEHPVTEAITGLDLVEWQLRVAAGEPLPLRQDQIPLRGHAIEARICAENPDNHFLPATGTLQHYAKPAHMSSFSVSPLRVDDGVRAGDAISPHYDSMIAKLIVHGDTREQALARLDAALAHMHIVGLHTNVQFLRQVVKSPSFAQAHLDTALIEREKAVLFQQPGLSDAQAVAAAVAHELAQEAVAIKQANNADDPLAQGSNWRLLDAVPRRFEFERIHAVQNAERPTTHLHAALVIDRKGVKHLQLAGVSIPWVDLQHATNALQTVVATASLESASQSAPKTCVYRAESGDLHVFAAQGAAVLKPISRPAMAKASTDNHAAAGLTAPMPGKLLSFAVKAGDTVKKGQLLATMEAMKMEHSIAAPIDGVVAELLYQTGEQVGEGSPLLRLDKAVAPN
jgi:3-methylcrotonyl-CoA carboxylase alpha subunit